jgi:hypothetical protein
LKTRSKKQEERVAKELGGVTTVGSGCFDFQPHDVMTEQFLCEVKYTGAKSFALNAQYLNSLHKEAMKDDKLMVLVLEFFDPPRGSYAVINYADFLAFKELLEDVH